VACGAGGPSYLVQSQIDALTGTNNTVTVTGNCVGDLQIRGASNLSIQGLLLRGVVYVQASTTQPFPAPLSLAH